MVGQPHLKVFWFFDIADRDTGIDVAWSVWYVRCRFKGRIFLRDPGVSETPMAVTSDDCACRRTPVDGLMPVLSGPAHTRDELIVRRDPD